ncbi:MAG: L,D-transpeptidase family protein [Thermodesulfovibrionales bacterium]|nr:L,D-transpeptidase family protein [Thermodesulfovibrionales bacterium]
MKGLLLFLFLIFVPYFPKTDIIIGGETLYVIEKDDTLQLIGAKLGVDWNSIAKENNIDISKPLKIGQELRVNNRKIVPKIVDNGIIINIPDRMLYYFKKGSLKAFTVGLGMPSWRGMTRWRTPLGQFKITDKRKNPTWHVPESMQWKMMMEGKPVKKIVPPGPDNPLGRYAIDTSIPRVVIHETIWPTTVYQFRSHGCVRVLSEHIEEFFEEVEINTSGEIIYSPVKVAVSEVGRVFLEVHRDIYGNFKDLRDEAKRLIKERGVSDKVDWQKADLIIKEKSGVAEDITYDIKKEFFKEYLCSCGCLSL